MAKTNKVRGAKANKFNNDYNLDWFEPSPKQQEALDKLEHSSFNIIDASSGCGKTSLALWWAFNQYKDNKYDKIIFIKTPCEVGSDPLGFLVGDAGQKLSAHMSTTRTIMWNFIAKNKLECDENNGNIRLIAPNFELGATYDNSIVIMDESQLNTKDVFKLLLERFGMNSKYLILGDSKQRYAVKSRGDGLTDFIERTSSPIEGTRDRVPHNPKMVSYTKITSADNMRSEESAFITDLYDE